MVGDQNTKSKVEEIIENENMKDLVETIEIFEPKNDLYVSKLLEMFEYKNLERYDDLLYPPVPKKLQDCVVIPVRDSKSNPKINRNSTCPCGSGKKYKNCCLKN